VRSDATLAGPASTDPDAEHARVGVLCTGLGALQAKSGGGRMPKQLEVKLECSYCGKSHRESGS
jgi:hypothetical protein